MSFRIQAARISPLFAVLLCAAGAAQSQTLTGWALLPAATFSDGPTSGQFAAANPYGTNLPPYAGRQPVQGFSAVLPGPRPDSVRFLVDNGFGGQANSADAVLRAYAVNVDWRTRWGGRGTVSPAEWDSGSKRRSFDAATRLELRDPDSLLGITIQADYTNYYDSPANPAVDATIRGERLLTGADFDIEGIVRDRNSNYWIGDEFGPYLLKTDASGKVLRREIVLPGVFAPQHKDVVAGTAVSNLPGSGGFEGMAISPDGGTLWTLLERTVAGDPAKTLRLNAFDIETETYTGVKFLYPLQPEGTAIGDMVAVDDTRFIVVERNGGTATSGTPFKKLFLIDISGLADGATVMKTELVDLMNLADPDDLNRDGSTVFTLPYVTIENVLVLNPRTLLVANDNNFPYGGGREAASDNTELLRITLPERLLDCRRCE